MEKLSSGLRINRAGDDAAGLAISEKMRGQIRGLDQASKNAQDGISLIQTAEGALNETHDILQRMRELATQASNDTNTTDDRGEIQKEINQLTSEINRIGNTTEFNTQKLLDGSKSFNEAVKGKFELTTGTSDIIIAGQTISYGTATTQWDTAEELKDLLTANTTISASYTASVENGKVVLTEVTGSATALTATGATVATLTTGSAAGTDMSLTLQIGANQAQSMSVGINDMTAVALGISSATTGTNFTAAQQVTNGTNNTGAEYGLDVSNSTNASAAITKIQTAIDKVSAERSKLGANQNRLEHTINNLGTSSENLTAAESRIRDVDMAKEMMAQTKNSILSQAAQAMLAQANQQPQGVLQLLR